MHFSVLEKVVEDGKNVSLHLLDPLQHQDPSLQGSSYCRLAYRVFDKYSVFFLKCCNFSEPLLPDLQVTDQHAVRRTQKEIPHTVHTLTLAEQSQKYILKKNDI